MTLLSCLGIRLRGIGMLIAYETTSKIIKTFLAGGDLRHQVTYRALTMLCHLSAYCIDATV